MAGSPGTTIGKRDVPLDSDGRAALGTFAGLGAPPTDGGATRLELGAVLGEGGMGVVRIAKQVAMGREVAVKTVRQALRAPATTLKLLQEAWTTGRLQHPNIIPVYDIATDDEGEPLIVLKRIEGETLTSVLAAPERARARYDIGDVLEWSLQVLIQVCNAVHFAHDQGVVHLDLKPENVMVGDHGEVYVVDWGIALALRDEGSGRLPLAHNHRGILGTPYYMAPEMLEGDGRLLDARTDVYLLGATLYEVIEGKPPHQGDTVMAAVYAALHETPELAEDVPIELAQICLRALARQPDQRFDTALELRRALQDFLRHRDSDRMASEAQAGLTMLGTLVEDGKHVASHELFGRTRFGFEQALASWSDNEAAQRGLADVFALAVTAELDHGDPEVASSLASQAPELAEELRDRVGQAVRQRRAGLDELAAHRLNRNLDVGGRTRFFVFVTMAAVWTLLPLLTNWVPVENSEQEYLLFLSGTALAVGLAVALGIWARESMTRTRVNRISLVGPLTALVGQALLFLAAYRVGAPAWQATCLAPLTWAAGGLVIAVAVDRRAWVVVLSSIVCCGLAASFPDARWSILSAGSLACLLVAAYVWWPRALPGGLFGPSDAG